MVQWQHSHLQDPFLSQAWGSVPTPCSSRDLSSPYPLSSTGFECSGNRNLFPLDQDIFLWFLKLFAIITLLLSQKVKGLAVTDVCKSQGMYLLVTCSLCGGEVILLLSGPYLPSLWPLSWQGVFLGAGLQSARRGLGLNEHRCEHRTSETPVRINGVLLQASKLKGHSAPLERGWHISIQNPTVSCAAVYYHFTFSVRYNQRVFSNEVSAIQAKLFSHLWYFALEGESILRNGTGLYHTCYRSHYEALLQEKPSTWQPRWSILTWRSKIQNATNLKFLKQRLDVPCDRLQLKYKPTKNNCVKSHPGYVYKECMKNTA